MIRAGSILNGRYRLDRLVAQGGFAQVFLARDLLLERQVAIKVLSPELTADPNFLMRFEREAKAVAALNHPNILSIHDYGQADGTAFLVMPYIQGGTLFDLLQSNSPPMSLTQIGRYLEQATAALDYAHRRGIVHRDIKPQNMLLLAEDDRLLLADFGIAKVLTSENANLKTGTLGTPQYMSPEQLQGQVVTATDIYALGCVLFRMLTGQLPYTGPTPRIVTGHMSEPVPSVTERSQGRVPKTLQPVLERALAKKPQDRYPTAGELYQAYQSAIKANQQAEAPTMFVSVPRPTPTLNQSPSPTSSYGYSAPQFPTPTSPNLPGPKKSSGLLWGIAAVAILMVAAIIALLVVLVGGNKTPEAVITSTPGGFPTTAPISSTLTVSPKTTGGNSTSAPVVSTFGTVYDAGGLKFIDPRPNLKKADPGKRGGTLNQASFSEARSLNYYLTSDRVSGEWASYLWGAARMVDVDLASGVTTINFNVVSALKVSDDRLTYTYSIRDGLKWSDGQPITGEDYVWTLKTALDPANKWIYRADYDELLDSFYAPDPKTVVFKMKRPEIYAIQKTDIIPLPKHIWEGKEWGDPSRNPEIDSPTVVSGPWKLKEWKRGETITFVRNDASTIVPPPLLDSMTITIFSNSSTQLDKLRKGDLDYVELASTDYDEVRKLSNVKVIDFYPAQARWTYVGLNFRRAYLQDIALRQAIAYATPVKELIDKSLAGLGQPIYSSVPQSFAGIYDPTTPRYDFNLDKAKKVLSDAGYKVEAGKLKDKTGQELPELKILTDGSLGFEAIADRLSVNLKELGITLTKERLSFQNLLDRARAEPYDYDMFTLGWSSNTTPETFNQVWKSLNYGDWNTPVAKEVIALYEKVNQEFDASKRKDLLNQIQQKTAQDLPYIFVYEFKDVFAVSDKFNISPVTAFGVSYNHFADWSLK